MFPIPNDAVPVDAPAPSSAIPSDAISVEPTPAPSIPPDVIPVDAPSRPSVPHDVTPAEDGGGFGSTFGELLKSVTGAIFGNRTEGATPLGPVVIMDAGDFYRDSSGNLKAFSTRDFIAPDPKTGKLMAFEQAQPEGVLGKMRDVASAVTPGMASTVPEGVALRGISAASRAAGIPKDVIPVEAAPVSLAEPPVVPGMVRLYHGGTQEDLSGKGARWFTSSRQYAEGYAATRGEGGKPALSFVDVPENLPGLDTGIPGQGIKEGFTVNLELPAEIANKRQPLNKAGTTAKTAVAGSEGSAVAAETAPLGTPAPAAETAASGAPLAPDALQAKINGLMAGDKVIMSPEQLSLLQTTSAAETAGSARAAESVTGGAATEPIIKEGLSRDVVGAITDMLDAGQVTMVNGIKPTDQVLALLRSDILPPETFQGILKARGVSPVEFTQSLLGEGMRESAKLAGQTLQQLSELQKVIAKVTDTPEAKALLASQRDDVGNTLRGFSGKVRGIYMSQLVGQLATSMRNALTAVATAGVDTLTKGMEQGLQTILVNPVRRLAGAPTVDDPIGAFTNWAMLARSAGRIGRKAVGARGTGVAPYDITKAITDALPDARAQLFGRYASDVSRATGHEGILGKLQGASEFLNFHGRFQEFVFRRAFFAAELQRRLEARGLNLDNIIKGNRIADISDEDIQGAVNEALRLTYGRPLGNSGFDQWMRAFNQVQTLGGRNPFPPVPFVRFMADAMKWQFEHSPFGAVRLLNKTERAALGPKGSLQVASRALVGSSMLYAAFLLRNSGYGGEDWFEMRVPGTDTKVDLRPFNPITNYLFVADLIKRSLEGTLQGMDFKQLAQGLIGANFRAGVGLYLVDDLINDIAGQGSAASKVKKIVTTWAGDTLAGFLTPFETLKDIAAQVYPEERIVRDQRQSPLTGPAMSRIPGVDMLLPPLASPTRAGPVEEQAPIVKQLTGVSVAEPKNAAEAELRRLGIQRREILPSSGNSAYDREMAKLMGPIVEKVVGNLVGTPNYQKLDNPGKAYLVTGVLRDIRGAAAKALPPDMMLKQQYAQKGVRERVFLESLFAKLPPERRDLLRNLLIR